MVVTSKTTQLEISHVADFYRRYPGEEVILYTRLKVQRSTKSVVTVNVMLPVEIIPLKEACQGPAEHGQVQIMETMPDQYQTIFWTFAGEKLEAGQSYEYQIKAKIKTSLKQDGFLKSWAEVTPQATAKDEISWLNQSTVLTIQARSRAGSLKYLPALYQDQEHELMWRYLMVFDYVWAMYDDLLTHQAFYFDPHLAPPNFQPWLASWVGLAWNERLSPSE